MLALDPVATAKAVVTDPSRYAQLVYKPPSVMTQPIIASGPKGLTLKNMAIGGGIGLLAYFAYGFLKGPKKKKPASTVAGWFKRRR